MYIHRRVGPDQLGKRLRGDVVDHDAPRVMTVHVPAPPIARQRDDHQSGTLREQVANKSAHTDPIRRRDAEHHDVRIDVPDVGHDVTERGDFGGDLDVGVSRQSCADYVAEERGHSREDDADRRHATSS